MSRTVDWRVLDLAAGESAWFAEPASGAAVCYLVEHAMMNQVKAWRERARW